jgi:hypothetical protein
MVLPKRNSAALCRTSVSHRKCRSRSKLVFIPYLYYFFMETQLSILEGSLTELLRFWCCQFQKLRSRRISSFWSCDIHCLRKSRRIASFWSCAHPFFAKVSQNCFVSDR